MVAVTCDLCFESADREHGPYSFLIGTLTIVTFNVNVLDTGPTNAYILSVNETHGRS